MEETQVDMMRDCIEELERSSDTSPERALELCGYIEYYAVSHAIAIGEKYGIGTGR